MAGGIDAKIAKYQALLRIDRDRIDDEVSAHAEHFEKVAEMHVLAIAEHDTIKQELEEAIAEADAVVRKSATEKLTETAVKYAIKDSPQVQDLTRELLKAKSRVDRCAVLKESFSQRSYMLKELVGLYIARRLSTNSHTAKGDLQEYAERRVESERSRQLRR